MTNDKACRLSWRPRLFQVNASGKLLQASGLIQIKTPDPIACN